MLVGSTLRPQLSIVLQQRSTSREISRLYHEAHCTLRYARSSFRAAVSGRWPNGMSLPPSRPVVPHVDLKPCSLRRPHRRSTTTLRSLRARSLALGPSSPSVVPTSPALSVPPGSPSAAASCLALFMPRVLLSVAVSSMTLSMRRVPPSVAASFLALSTPRVPPSAAA